ncbi:hypothetical protein A4X13_0g7740 [Tilletia indica]|uniref:Uncharacterized protein n=1 Tax=Tilletia indica TaxID=43049 RepID=A0A177T7T7_9BASI|nr:hypothetical protein A4X13_0g7740 [Tilletia indica]
MENARSLGYLHQRMLERAEDAPAALRAAIGPTITDLATLPQQSSGANIGLHSHHHDDEEDDDSDDPSLDDLDESDMRTSSAKKAKTAATSPHLARILTSLDSSSDEERIDGLRRIIAAGRYRIAHAALPAAFKLTSSSITSLHVPKPVSVILARSDSAQPDLALLAFNSFQRDLSHHSPLIAHWRFGS